MKTIDLWVSAARDIDPRRAGGPRIPTLVAPQDLLVANGGQTGGQFGGQHGLKVAKSRKSRFTETVEKTTRAKFRSSS